MPNNLYDIIQKSLPFFKFVWTEFIKRPKVQMVFTFGEGYTFWGGYAPKVFLKYFIKAVNLIPKL